MKIYILDSGWIECDANRMVNYTTVATNSNRDVKHKWIKIPVWSLLIEHPQAGYIIYDFSRSPQEDFTLIPQRVQELFPYYWHEQQNMQTQLAGLGLQATDIKTAVLSHFHFDHMGNAPLFVHCELYVPKLDFANAKAITSATDDIEEHGSYIKKYVELPFKKITLVEPDKDVEIFPGITLLNLPGHTPGLLGLMVELKESGTLIFPSDAIYTAENYGPPVRASGNIYDSLAFFASIEKIRALQKKKNAKIIFSHDMSCFQALKKAPEYYD